ncbi:hypothetical protein KQH82_07295 [bacterium]|nr:hypothetical protein [bacterium]
MTGKTWCLSVALLLAAAPSYARIIEVPSDYTTVQAAVDDATFGDTIRLQPGTYSGPGNRDIDLSNIGIVITSAGSFENTTLDLGGSAAEPHRAFLFDGFGPDTGTVVDGITFVNGNHQLGGVVYSQGASPRFRNCRFINNIGGSGGVVFSTYFCTVRFSDCLFVHNIATGSGGVLMSYGAGGASFLRCTFVRNQAAADGGAAWCSDFSRASFENCTLYDGSATRGSGGAAFAGGEMVFRSTIVAFGTGGQAVYVDTEDIPWYPGYASIECTDIFGNTGGDWVGYIEDFEHQNGNLSEDPLFCNISSEDFSLASSSPCAPTNNPCGLLIGAWPVGSCIPEPVCGDANGDSRVDLSDLMFLVSYYFFYGPAPSPLGAGDQNGDGTVDLTDLVYLSFYLFRGGDPPYCP